MPDPKPPPPGLDGTYRGACVTCMRGTDSGIALYGPFEFAIAGLVALGMPQEGALVLVPLDVGLAPDQRPDGDIIVWIRVCEECAKASQSGFVPGILPYVPVYSPGVRWRA